MKKNKERTERSPCLVYSTLLLLIYADSFLLFILCSNFNRQTNERVFAGAPLFLSSIMAPKINTLIHPTYAEHKLKWPKDMHILMQIFNSRHIFFCHHRIVAFEFCSVHSGARLRPTFEHFSWIHRNKWINLYAGSVNNTYGHTFIV